MAETSFEQSRPPREQLEFAINGLIHTAKLESNPGLECIETADGFEQKEKLTLVHNTTTTTIKRGTDTQNMPQTYIVSIKDRLIGENVEAGLAWRIGSQAAPYIFDIAIVEDTDYEISRGMTDWLSALGHDGARLPMPKNPLQSRLEALAIRSSRERKDGTDYAKLADFLGEIAIYYDIPALRKIFRDPSPDWL